MKMDAGFTEAHIKETTELLNGRESNGGYTGFLITFIKGNIRGIYLYVIPVMFGAALIRTTFFWGRPKIMQMICDSRVEVITTTIQSM